MTTILILDRRMIRSKGSKGNTTTAVKEYDEERKHNNNSNSILDCFPEHQNHMRNRAIAPAITTPTATSRRYCRHVFKKSKEKNNNNS
eukprot:CAMPEP_0170871140 /NCGR_PEP_ID=MMETSP0734-20130129/25625_1 /TAXON_ID=186038 /ORGANISM="Fragilariopsis kerguelensis, Strain L26-C5" /LENGTH=87 /DNA_ID=CAMNT_0011250341 /DNA_START=838 /DNA_END=1098 /DNA_ORIENTATION=+